MKITQSQFIERLAASLGITYSRAEEMVHAFKEFVYSELAAGNSVEFSGFGQFLVSHRDARIGVNPRKPSQRITIPELNTPKFKAGEAFKKAISINN